MLEEREKGIERKHMVLKEELEEEKKAIREERNRLECIMCEMDEK